MEILKKYIDYYNNKNLSREYQYTANLNLLNKYKYDFESFLSYNFNIRAKIKIKFLFWIDYPNICLNNGEINAILRIFVNKFSSSIDNRQ